MLLNIQNASPCQRLLFMCPVRDTLSVYAQQCNEWTLPPVLMVNTTVLERHLIQKSPLPKQ